jgi:hypothetical protein
MLERKIPWPQLCEAAPNTSREVLSANAIAKVLNAAELICNGAPLGSGQS